MTAPVVGESLPGNAPCRLTPTRITGPLNFALFLPPHYLTAPNDTRPRKGTNPHARPPLIEAFLGRNSRPYAGCARRMHLKETGGRTDWWIAGSDLCLCCGLFGHRRRLTLTIERECWTASPVPDRERQRPQARARARPKKKPSKGSCAERGLYPVEPAWKKARHLPRANETLSCIAA